MYKIFAILLLFFCSTVFSYSQVNILIETVPPLFNVNTDEFPLIKMNVRVSEGNNQVQLSKNDYYILEGAMVCEPIEVTPIQNGWQTVSYYTKLYDFTRIGEYQAVLLTLYKNNPYRMPLRGALTWLPMLKIVSGKNNQQIRNLSWPIVQPPFRIPEPLMLSGFLMNSRTFQNRAIKIDSLTTRTPFFTVDWRGPEDGGDLRRPPSEISTSANYIVNIFFAPLEYKYYQDVLTVHFNNGMKRHIPLYGNSFKVDIEKLLEITEPKPASIFSPCQDVTIKWKGHDPSNPVEVYYSTNAGIDWKLIEVVLDSMLTWRIPNIETPSFRFKVRQGFNNTKEERLSEDRFPVYSVNYNYGGTKLSSFNSFGKILTYNLATGDKAELQRRQFLEELNEESEEKYSSFGLEYSVNDNKFYIGYRDNVLPSFLQRDSIAVFNDTDIYPVKKIALPAGFRAKTTKSDRLKKYIAVFPEYGSKILRYSMTDESPVGEINFEAPIMDIAFNSNSDSAAVLLINGRVKLVRLDSFTIFEDLDFDIFPNFLNIAYSPNGRFLALGTQSDNSGLTTDIYLIDIASRRIVRVFNPSAGDPVALQFNPTSTSLVVGSKTDKQIAVYDLTTNSSSSNLFGHTGLMTDLKMSPSGFSIVSTSMSFTDNIMYRSFTYPQEDQSGGSIFIELPKLNDNIVQIERAYQGTFKTHNIATVCNIGRSMADITDAKFKFGTNFQLQQQWQRDTAFAGACFNFDVIYNPIDTGIVRDTLILTHCSKNYFIPFESYSIPRTITLLNDGFDFGDVCIGDTLTREFPLFRNDDPVPLILNFTLLNDLGDVSFDNLKQSADTVLQPGEIFIARLRFVPTELGPHTAEVAIHHSNQLRIFKTSKIRGTGIGSFVEISHETLRFIPEILTRELTLKNAGGTDIQFDAFRVAPQNVFDVITPAGFILRPGESKIIEVRWNGTNETPAQLIIDANPCLIQRYIGLEFYRGSSVIELPIVLAEAYDEKVRIPVLYSNSENGPYDGVRTFTADFTVNSKIFLPTSVVTNHGKAEITSNGVFGGVRTFGIRAEGNFPKNDTIFTIIGVAGLTDTDRSPLIMLESLGWSRFVNISKNDGEIVIIGICEDRYIVRRNQIISDILVIPNPATEAAKLRFELTESTVIRCDIIDNTGNSILVCNDFNGHSGENILDLNLSKFGTGNYKVRLSSANDFQIVNLIIIR